MEKLVFKVIDKEEDLKMFLGKFFNYTNVNLPLNYAQGAKVIGVYIEEVMVAGYMLVTTPNFRSLLFVPDKQKKSKSFFRNDPYEMMEVNGLWIGSQIKEPRLQYRIWMQIIKDIFLSKKKYLLLMGNSKNRNVEYLHSLTNPEILYMGSPALLPGDESFNTIRVAYTTRWKLVSNLPKYWLEYRSRERRKVQSPKSKTLTHSSTMA